MQASISRWLQKRTPKLRGEERCPRWSRPLSRNNGFSHPPTDGSGEGKREILYSQDKYENWKNDNFHQIFGLISRETKKYEKVFNLVNFQISQNVLHKWSKKSYYMSSLFLECRIQFIFRWLSDFDKISRIYLIYFRANFFSSFWNLLEYYLQHIIIIKCTLNFPSLSIHKYWEYNGCFAIIHDQLRPRTKFSFQTFSQLSAYRNCSIQISVQ